MYVRNLQQASKQSRKGRTKEARKSSTAIVRIVILPSHPRAIAYPHAAWVHIFGDDGHPPHTKEEARTEQHRRFGWIADVGYSR